MAGLASFAPILPIFVLVWRIRALIRRFQNLNAVAPESAVSHEELNVRRAVIFRRLVHQGVIGTVGEDRYYLDTDRYQEWRAARRRRALIALALIVILFTAAWLAGWVTL
jgi:hypothetical protein